jgi:hypothetical protein
MSQSKPSPAPWSYEQFAGTCGIVDANGSIIADAIGKADGALMVAAPLLLAELRRLEWSCNTSTCCPSCGRFHFHGHKPDCTLAAALRAAGEGPDVAP